MATLQELADLVQGEVIGDPDLIIQGVSEIQPGKPGTITFLSDPKYRKYLLSTKASAIVLSDDIEIGVLSVIRVENPALAFSRIMKQFSQPPSRISGIHPTAVVESDVKLGENVSIGPNVVIEKEAKIGDEVSIEALSYVGQNSIIGNHSVLKAHVAIYHDCVVGQNVLIHSGTVVGSDGFGYVTEKGIHHKVPQIGRVVVEDNVEIGSNCSIDRGTIGDTVIGEGSKIDNLVHIAHNVELGKGCFMTGQVGVAGSSKIGDYVAFGGQVGVSDHVEIGDHTRLAAKTGVTKSLPGGKTYAGMPAREIQKKNRADALTYRLPELVKKIKTLEEEIKKLKGDL